MFIKRFEPGLRYDIKLFKENKMKKILYTILILCAGINTLICQPVQLKNFKETLNSLKNGNSVRVVVYYKKCKLITGGKEEQPPDAVGGMELKSFEYFAKGSVNNEKSYIASSEIVLISHPRYGMVYNYIKFRFFEDNTVEITARYIDPKTYEVKMDESFYSYIDDMNNDAAVMLYTYRQG